MRVCQKQNRNGKMRMFYETLSMPTMTFCPANVRRLFHIGIVQLAGQIYQINKNKIKLFHIISLLCSDGTSTVGKYTGGLRDDVRMPFSVLNRAKFFSLWHGRSFKNSLID